MFFQKVVRNHVFLMFLEVCFDESLKSYKCGNICKCVKKWSQRRPRTGGNEPCFSSLFRLWPPNGAPGAPKGAQSEPKCLPKPDPGEFRTRFLVFLDFDATLSYNCCFHGSWASEIDQKSHQNSIKTAHRKKHTPGTLLLMNKSIFGQKVLPKGFQRGYHSRLNLGRFF